MTERATPNRSAIHPWLRPRPPQRLRPLARVKPGRAPAPARQPRRPLPDRPPAQHRDIRRGQPEDAGDLIDPPPGVGQRHDRQVPHPDIVGGVAVDHETTVGDHAHAVADDPAQHTGFGHPVELDLLRL
ncbi:hypothetical protein [Dietzia sp. 111N12-1]|uniref:hypothetical protein n=1 Tax=Dietzia sp. 111N12-1 TaxID=1785156 RepID=UPI0012E78253|nr:hypothetical protein [Dietzia sp. 111N12-1]